MTALRDYFRRWAARPLIRPWALAAPVVVLVIALPLLRPLRHPSQVSRDEQHRLATVRALVEHRTLAIDHTLPQDFDRGVVRREGRLYSAQPPMMALLLSAPAWLMRAAGFTFDENHLFISYVLTLLGVTLPVAAGTGLIYRMGRLFELPRPWRTGLALAVVLGSGLISYAVVLNPHAPAAALVLASAACLIHVASVDRARPRWTWLLLAGASAGLAATLDPAAAIVALLFMFVIAAMRFRIGFRAAGVLLYLAGVAAPVLVHAKLNEPVTGDWLPASVHGSTYRAARAAIWTLEDDDASRSLWSDAASPIKWLANALVGRHGMFSHFPVLVLGIAGVGAVMHRHWPGGTKTLAAATVVSAVTIVLLYYIGGVDWRDAMFASRWFILFLPMLVFWSGAWARRSHRRRTWALAGSLLGFSVIVSLIGAMAGPFAPDGFDGYTAIDALQRLISQPEPATPPAGLAGGGI